MNDRPPAKFAACLNPPHAELVHVLERHRRAGVARDYGDSPMECGVAPDFGLISFGEVSEIRSMVRAEEKTEGL